MLNFSYEDALKNFSSLVDNVVTEHAVVSVSRSPKESVVMLSKDDYDSIRQSSVPASAHASWSSSPLQAHHLYRIRITPWMTGSKFQRSS
ncbi:type II toxin-antitoxin system Phd/YefM family antitoxin [Glutamicibacter ardleyensis]|uniref:type II toxin-antitoxin system Phd/YefM family antitoxin n=1 Tax=Glutamicibacter ardleyensis TaxID=225894 RepID=UPI003FCEFDDB